MREGRTRFPSIDECLRIEIEGSPLAELVDAAAYERVRAAAPSVLGRYCDGDGRLAMPLNASILAARKP